MNPPRSKTFPTTRWTALLRIVIACFLMPVPSVQAAPPAPTGQWNQWRGPDANGVNHKANPPITWSERENIRWKIPLPGKGHSSPIVWGDLIFLTTAVPHGPEKAGHGRHAPGAHDNHAPLQKQKFLVMAISRTDGRILWQRAVRNTRPHESAHVTGSWASASMVTDGQRLYAFFGSQGLYCLDMRGFILWSKDLGDMEIFHGHGEGSSPFLFEDTLIVNWDHQKRSFLVALDKVTGRELWRVERDEITSWSTPIVVEHGGVRQVIVSATGRTRGYRLKDGAVLWEVGGLSRNVVSSPVFAEGFVYVGSSYTHQAMLGIDLSKAKGTLKEGGGIVWKKFRNTPYVPSPVLYGAMLCYNRHLSGYFTCVHAKSGKKLFGPKKLNGIRRMFSSPVGANDRIYAVGKYGTTVVIKKSSSFQVIAQNRLDDVFTASPAVIDDALILRGERFLYYIAR